MTSRSVEKTRPGIGLTDYRLVRKQTPISNRSEIDMFNFCHQVKNIDLRLANIKSEILDQFEIG